MLTATDIDSLITAIDSGDDEAMLALADAIDEAPRSLLKDHSLKPEWAAGLRKVYASDRRPEGGVKWEWYACCPENEFCYPFWVSEDVIGWADNGSSYYHRFPTRSAALIFLAKKFVEKGLI